MFFHDFLGGRTLKTMPSLKGSSESTSSSSASPPSVIIWYISLRRSPIVLKPAMNSASRCLRSSSKRRRCSSRCSVTESNSARRARHSASRARYSASTVRLGDMSASASSSWATSAWSSLASSASSSASLSSGSEGAPDPAASPAASPTAREASTAFVPGGAWNAVAGATTDSRPERSAVAFCCSGHPSPCGDLGPVKPAPAAARRGRCHVVVDHR
mmetsp:Transcript_24402/g.76794  ORF Transcript_24402/g.76794 Transcript_24402/m.76794 type:complete len:216 (+) Transcript_24402:355-1002(+)